MDILNFISWIKSSNYRTTLPTDVQSLLVIGAKDPSRDDGYLSLAINTAPLQSVYDKGTVTQLTSITTGVTLNTHCGVITTVSSTLGSLLEATFTVTNSVVKPDSVILVSTQYVGTGHGDAGVGTIGTGTFTITVANPSLVALNSVLKIHYMIIA